MAKSSGPNPLPFIEAATVGRELDYLREAVGSGRLGGVGPFTLRCETLLGRQLGARRALLTHSCTGALEMAAMLCGVGPGDEVVMPSFTFTSTATAFVLRGAVPVFVDIRADTLNMDERLIEAALTPRTRAIVPVHYAGRGCAMATIGSLAQRHGLMVVEDAAQAYLSTQAGRALGTFGQLGCLSFHATKNTQAGEGGAILVNDEALVPRAEILREKGTDRSRYLRGEVDRYTWKDIGSSWCPAELVSAYLLAQLEAGPAVAARRRAVWSRYAAGLAPLAARGDLTLPSGDAATHNGHIFHVLMPDAERRQGLIEHLRAHGIGSAFHYVPLHSAPAGRRFGRAHGTLEVTDRVAATLVRLPIWPALEDADVDRVIEAVGAYLVPSRRRSGERRSMLPALP